MSTPDRALKSLRLRLQHLTTALATFHHSLASTPAHSLPPPATLESHFAILSFQLASTLSTLSTYLLSHGPHTLISYPPASFPARHHEHVLCTLQTKKHQPEIRQASETAKKEVPEESRELVQTREVVWERFVECVKEKCDDVVEEEMEARKEVESGMQVREGKGRKTKLEGVLRFMGTGVIPE